MMSANEPESAKVSSTVDIPVIRTGGSRGVVAVQWKALMGGSPPIKDISPTSGTVYFVSNEARHMITLSILHDDDPEGLEVSRNQLLTLFLNCLHNIFTTWNMHELNPLLGVNR